MKHRNKQRSPKVMANLVTKLRVALGSAGFSVVGLPCVPVAWINCSHCCYWAHSSAEKSHGGTEVSQNEAGASSYGLFVHGHLAKKSRTRNQNYLYNLKMCNLGLIWRWDLLPQSWFQKNMQGEYIAITLLQFWVTYTDNVRCQEYNHTSLSKYCKLPVTDKPL